MIPRGPGALRRLARRSEAFGVLDAGLASLATFGVGMVTARVLSPLELGAYALCFRAVFLAGVISSHGIFLPAESLAAVAPASERLRLMARSLRLGVPIALAAGGAVSLWLFLAPSVPRHALVALTVTAMATAFLSPVQDHVRRMLHVGGASRAAALVSGVQLGLVVSALLGCFALGVAKWWIPFGTLAIANLGSGALGIYYARRTGDAPRVPPALPRARVWELGRWLMLVTLLDSGSAFLAVALVAHLAGAAAVGYAEAARLAAHPVMVLAWGLSGVLCPKSVRAGSERDKTEARRVARLFVWLLAAGGGASLVLLGVNWIGNPMVWLVPVAYTVPGLVALTIVAHVCLGAPFPARAELIGARWSAAMAKVDAQATVMRVLIAASATITQAYAVPASLAVSGMAQWIGYHRRLRTLYPRQPGLVTRPPEAQHAGS